MEQAVKDMPADLNAAEQAQKDLEANVKEIMEKPMGFYNRERGEGELDLVKEVRQRMVAIGLGDRLPECFDNNRFIQEAKDKTTHAQQYNLTRYFSTQFMAAKEDTSVARYALIYEVRGDQWLKIFEESILPEVVNHNLPVKL